MGDDGDVNYYLKMVCLDKEVALMENGVDTLIGSSGVRLSGGLENGIRHLGVVHRLVVGFYAGEQVRQVEDLVFGKR